MNIRWKENSGILLKVTLIMFKHNEKRLLKHQQEKKVQNELESLITFNFIPTTKVKEKLSYKYEKLPKFIWGTPNKPSS